MSNPEAKPAAGGLCLGRGLALVAVFVAGFCFCGAFVLSKNVEVVGSPLNAFFDMDVNRVVEDLTTLNEAGRARTHPLFKFLALPGMALNGVLFGGEDPLSASRVFCLLGVLTQVVLTGLLARRMGAGAGASLLAAALVGVSFASLVIVAIPDAAALSGVFTLLPFLLAYGRSGKPLTKWEAAAWAVIGVAAFGITISQIAWFFLALAFRLRELAKLDDRLATKATAKRLAMVLVPMVLLIAGMLNLQHVVFEETERNYRIDKILKKEFKYMETDELQQKPLLRLFRQVTHVAVVDFAAPAPIITAWSPPRDDRQFISMTLVETDFRTWHTWQVPLVLSQVLLLAFWCWRFRWRRELWPVALALAGQFVLHFVYGREFVIYALNWHGLLLAFAAATWLQEEKHRKPLAAWVIAHVLALAVSNSLILAESFEMYRTEFPLQEAYEIIEPPK